VDEPEPDDAANPSKGSRIYRKLPKPIGEMTDDELDEFAGEMADAMFQAREERLKRDEAT
jgi:hypothetical protein